MHAAQLVALFAAGSAAASYQAGVEALKRKDAPAAIAALSACVAAAPGNADCHWELGWGHWLAADWPRVVASWERVEALEPDRPELARHLADARRQLRLAESLAEERSAAPSTVAPTAAAADRRLRLRAVGDVMLGTDFPEGYLPPEDGAQMLAGVSALLSDADVTFINLEGPLCDGGETNKCRPGQNCYAFRTPTRYGRYLKDAGVDLASTANNHSGDFGETCRRQTEETLDALGIAWSGPPGSVASIERDGLRIGMVAFHTAAGCNYLNDQAGAEALVRSTAARHDITVVSFHGGAEGRKALRVPDARETFYGENRGHLRMFARGVVEAGADLVLGHGPHVPRAMEVHRGRLIAYSLGNFATYGRFNLSGPLALGLVLEVELDGEGRFLGGRILPTRQVGKGVPVLDDEARTTDLMRRLSRQDFPDSGVRIAKDGTLAARTSGE